MFHGAAERQGGGSELIQVQSALGAFGQLNTVAAHIGRVHQDGAGQLLLNVEVPVFAVGHGVVGERRIEAGAQSRRQPFGISRGKDQTGRERIRDEIGRGEAIERAHVGSDGAIPEASEGAGGPQ